MPYGFYQLVRYLALMGFVILAYKCHSKNEEAMVIVYIGLAILFQPLIKISLGRTLWNIIDIVVGIGLVSSIIIKPIFIKGTCILPPK